MNNRYRYLWLLLPLAAAAFIFWNSTVAAEASDRMTLGFLGSWLADAIKACAGWISGAAPTAEALFALVRKLAHFAEFGLLGVTLYVALRMVCGFVPDFLRTLLAGVLAALCDETIQLFTPGRTGLVADVWLDVAGFTLGVLLCMLVDFLVCHGRLMTAANSRSRRKYFSI